MTVAYSDNLIYNNFVDSLTERKGGFRPPCHNNIVRMNTTEVFMGKCIDLTGQKFGRLTVIKRAENKGTRATWLCKCDCGNELIVVGKNLRTGNTKSCGCYQQDIAREAQTKHKGSNTRLYGVWACMIQRCSNPNNCSYKRYGARGIKVYEEWFDFVVFQNWALQNGYADNLSIDRIDVNGNYEPSNCRWATQKEQCQNTRKNHNITINGETHCINEWARIYNIKREIIKDRILRGWDEVKAVITPKISNKENK